MSATTCNARMIGTDYRGESVLQPCWYDSNWDAEASTYFRSLPLLFCHLVLFRLQERIIRRIAEYEADATEQFERAAERGVVHRLTDTDEDRWYLSVAWCDNYARLADIVLKKERDEIEQLIAAAKPKNYFTQICNLMANAHCEIARLDAKLRSVTTGGVA